MQFLLPRLTEAKGIRVLTSKQIADMYGTTTDVIKKNFSNNRRHFLEGKHYISLVGDDLRAFKNKVKDVHLVGNTARILYIWTEKGALLHAKSVNTDRAWQAYEFLIDYYFRAEEQRKVPVTVETNPVPVQEKKKQELPQMDNPIRILKVLLKVAEDKGIKVNSFPFGTVDSMLKGNHIGIRTEVTVEKACYELAWELSHAFIHYDGGDMIKSPLSKDYNDQATRAAEMVVKILNVKMSQM